MSNASTVCLNKIGYDERYVLYPQGFVINTKTNKKVPMYGHKFNLLGKDNKYHSVALKTIYRQCYNVEYCIDNTTNLPNEEWRQVVVDKNADATGYLVSNLGRVKSLKGYTAIILKPYTNDGYAQVKIDETVFRVHRLVALAFIPNNDKSKTTVDHINGNTLDNRACNLQWLSLIDNVKKEWDGRKLEKERIKSAATQ